MMRVRKGLIGWALFGAYVGAQVAHLSGGVAPRAAEPTNFEDYQRYETRSALALPVTFSVPETSETAAYTLSLPRVAMPYIPRASLDGPISKIEKGAGRRGTLTKSRRFPRMIDRQSTIQRQVVVRSESRGRTARAVINYGVSAYGFK